MTGDQLFEKYGMNTLDAPMGSDEREYGQTLRTAFFAVGKEILYPMLEEAERTGQRIELTHPIPFEDGYSEPDGIRLVAMVAPLER